MVSIAESTGHYNFGTEFRIHDKSATVVVPVSGHQRLAATKDDFPINEILDTIGHAHLSHDLQVVQDLL